MIAQVFVYPYRKSIERIRDIVPDAQIVDNIDSIALLLEAEDPSLLQQRWESVVSLLRQDGYVVGPMPLCLKNPPNIVEIDEKIYQIPGCILVCPLEKSLVERLIQGHDEAMRRGCHCSPLWIFSYSDSYGYIEDYPDAEDEELVSSLEELVQKIWPE